MDTGANFGAVFADTCWRYPEAGRGFLAVTVEATVDEDGRFWDGPFALTAEEFALVAGTADPPTVVARGRAVYRPGKTPDWNAWPRGTVPFAKDPGGPPSCMVTRAGALSLRVIFDVPAEFKMAAEHRVQTRPQQ
jgi:hypothetical protein